MWFGEVNIPVVPAPCALFSSQPRAAVPPHPSLCPSPLSRGDAARDAHSRSCSLPRCQKSRRKRQSTTGLTALPSPKGTPEHSPAACRRACEASPPPPTSGTPPPPPRSAEVCAPTCPQISPITQVPVTLHSFASAITTYFLSSS